MDDNIRRAREVDWSQYISSMPLEGVRVVRGEEAQRLRDRLRRAWRLATDQAIGG